MRFPIDTIADNLMLPVEEMRANNVEEQTIRRILRLRDIYNFMLRNPLKKDREYIDYIQANYREDDKPLSKRKAYEDIEILHAVIGNLQQCTKEWHRWRFNNMIAEGYAIALRNNDAMAIARLAGMYGKYNKLDKEDEHDFGFSQIPKISFTFDVSVIGFKPIANVQKVIRDLFAEFSHSYIGDVVEDADVEEIIDAIDERKKEIKEIVHKNDNPTAIS
jgi:hypothetical protein